MFAHNQPQLLRYLQHLGLSLIALLYVFSSQLSAEPQFVDQAATIERIDADAIEALNQKIEQALHDKDYATIESVFLGDALLFIDMSASNSDEPVRMTLAEYMALMRSSLAMISDLEFETERVRLSIADDGQSAKLLEKNRSSMTMLDIEVTSTELVYSVLQLEEGQLRIAEIRSHVIADNSDDFERQLLEKLNPERSI